MKSVSPILDQHCTEIGRDPSTITRSMQVRVNLNDPERARNDIRGYIEAGPRILS